MSYLLAAFASSPIDWSKSIRFEVSFAVVGSGMGRDRPSSPEVGHGHCGGYESGQASDKRARRSLIQDSHRGNMRRRIGCGRAALFAVVGMCVCLCVGGDDDPLLRARLEVGDLFNLRKAMSGEHIFPERYRSYARAASVMEDDLEKCCTGSECTECIWGETVENLQASKFFLEQEVRLLQKLGCPCDIVSIFPELGGFHGGTPVEVTVSELSLDQAFELGPVDCWWRVEDDLEHFTVIPAQRLEPGTPRYADTVVCVTPEQTGPVLLEVTLHGQGWALTTSTQGSNIFEMYNAGDLVLTSVKPQGTPTQGGIILTIAGVDFDTTRPMQCRIAGVRFPAQVLDNATATCTTPQLSAGQTTLTLSQNGYDWTLPGIPFGVYDSPKITVLFPGSGLGGEVVRMNVAGLGLFYTPEPSDIYCKWILPAGEITYQAVRIGASSTLSCNVPNNTLGKHWIAGPVPVEVSLQGPDDSMFTHHDEDAPNKFVFGCKNVDVLYAQVVDFWPQCTDQRCCPAGYFSNNGDNCTKCGDASYSYIGQTYCYDCPANSNSPPGSPAPMSCICNEGYVPSSGTGLIEAPWDTCVTCPAGKYAYTTPETWSDRLSTTKFTTGVFPVASKCMQCPSHSSSAGDATAVTGWSCICNDGYVCSFGDVLCAERLDKLTMAWSNRTCLASNNTELPSAISVEACKRVGLLAQVNHGPPGPRLLPCDYVGGSMCASIIAGTEGGLNNLTADNSTCECQCDHLEGYRANASLGPAGMCEDIDECQEGTHSCNGSHIVCYNQRGGPPGYRCGCMPGYDMVNGTCVDVNECARETADCHELAACTNTNGSFTCTCRRGYDGDGVLDCSDGAQIRCTPAIEVLATTAQGSQCWAINNAASNGAPFYCDGDAGTRSDIWFRFYWLEVQGWSEEMVFAHGMVAGESKQKIELDLRWAASPALIQYRVSGTDAWHPSDLGVRPFGQTSWYRPAASTLCWVDGNACNGQTCFAQDGCGVNISTSYTYDFDECALGLHRCSSNAVCSNMYGAYNCSCNAGYYGVGTTVIGSGSECLQCAAGTYAQATGQTSCNACPALTTGPVGSTSALNCSCMQGYYGAISMLNAQCQPCPAASYCPGGLLSMSCPEGAWSPPLAGDISDCVCTPGWYGPNGGPCTLCPSGHWCEGGWQLPRPCEAGEYAEPGWSVCMECPANSNSTAASLTCSCAAGFFDANYFARVTQGTCVSNGCLPIVANNPDGVSRCGSAARLLGLTFSSNTNVSWASSECGAVGSVVYQGGDAAECTDATPCICQSCAPAQCDMCPEATYAAEGAYECTSCTQNAYSDAGSALVTDCMCTEGYFGTIMDDSSTCAPCQQGTYAQYLDQDACDSCPAGTFASSTGMSVCSDCQEFASSPQGSTSSSQCACQNGSIADAPGSCANVDECADNSHNCDVLATCTDTQGSFTCACPATTYGDGVFCQVCDAGFSCDGTDSVACPPGTYSLQAASTCSPCPAESDSPESSTDPSQCICNVGWTSSGGACVDIDECATGTHDCDLAATCSSTQGSFTCTCGDSNPGEGTRDNPCLSVCGDGLHGYGESCDDSNLMVGDGCSDTCSIEAGWNCSSFSSCVSIPQCQLSTLCASNAACLDVPGAFRCVCNVDFYGDGSLTGVGCTACPTHSSTLGATNVTALAGCLCDVGYENPADSLSTCVNQDECMDGSHNCDAYGACLDTEASFTCTCNDGFVNVTGDGTTCAQVDECAYGTHNCDGNATCTDTFGSFTCACNVGQFDVSQLLLGTIDSCRACARGTFSSVRGATACRACPTNALSPSGSSSVLDCTCISGYYGTISSVSDTCTPCAIGSYSSTPGSATCSLCGSGATSLIGSASAASCFCPIGTYSVPGTVLTCATCPSFASSPARSQSVSDCTCVAGYYSNGTSGANLRCVACAPCQTGFQRVGCGLVAAGVCVEVDECTAGTHTCDRRLAVCANTVGSFTCTCVETSYGNGTLCRSCPRNAYSGFGSTVVSNCTCNGGFDVGDGITASLTSPLETCTTAMQVSIATAAGNRSTCWTSSETDYCDQDSGTTADVWIRVRWTDGVWTDWYALFSPGPHGFEPPTSKGFNFSAGGVATAYLPSISYVGGEPAMVEYYVAGDDSWRPQSVAVRLPDGLIISGVGAWYSTSGMLCWVDADGQAYSQESAGCPYVGQSATATLRTGNSSTNASSVAVGLFRAEGSPHSADALRHEDALPHIDFKALLNNNRARGDSDADMGNGDVLRHTGDKYLERGDEVRSHDDDVEDSNAWVGEAAFSTQSSLASESNWLELWT